ncbi:MAG: cobalt-precorrin-5B (C(1))-methyltransferase [Pilosibacter sp.]
MDTFVYKDHKKLRCGYTTGTCAALAAQGAVRFLLTGSWKETEEIMTPKGVPVCVSLEEKTSGDSWAECAVRKDAGDDYDVTNGILVYARAEFVKDKNFYEKVQMSHLESSGFGAAGEKPGLSPENQKQQKKANAAHQKEALPESLVRIDGGIGIGRITKSGLDQPVGAAAINSVPRKMIRDCLRAFGGSRRASPGIDHNIGSCRRRSREEDLQPGPGNRGRDLRSRDQRDCGAHE